MCLRSAMRAGSMKTALRRANRAIGREIQASDMVAAEESLSGLIQPMPPIISGIRAGLVNLGGEVIGSQPIHKRPGIGFAIRWIVKSVIESVKKFGRIIARCWSVTHTLLNKKKKELKLNESKTELWLRVTERKRIQVLQQPAEKAGLRVDDVIVEVDGEKITEEKHFKALFKNMFREIS